MALVSFKKGLLANMPSAHTDGTFMWPLMSERFIWILMIPLVSA